MSVRIAPSLLSADFARLAEAVRSCEEGGADLIHFDVMDGRFVPNLTVGPIVLKALRRETSLPFDVHLMIEEPFRTIDQYLSAGAARVAVHVEAEPHLHRLARHVRQAGAIAGVALNPGTALAALDEAILFVDFVLVMSVDPGWGGQAFQTRAIPRVEELVRRANATRGAGATPLEISVDGGVDTSNAGALAAAGATQLVAGASVFGRPSVAEAIRALRESARSLPVSSVEGAE